MSSLAGETSSDPTQQAWKLLRLFEGRARRVLDSELAKRDDLATLGTTMRIISRVGESDSTILYEHPPIEHIESAAARFRPIALNEDPVYYYKALNALGLLTKSSSPEAKGLVKALRQAWKEWETAKTWAMFAGKVEDPTDQMPQTWDRDIARDWLYGDLVHADEEAQHRIRFVPETDRIMAALLWLKDGIRLTSATHRAIVDLEEAGELR